MTMRNEILWRMIDVIKMKDGNVDESILIKSTSYQLTTLGADGCLYKTFETMSNVIAS
jgi:hypothetical protein